MEFIVEMFFGLISLVFYKAYRLRHPELLGKPAEELALTFAKLQLIHNPRALRFLMLSPILPAIVIVAGLISKTDMLMVILIAGGAWFLEILGLLLFIIPIMKFSAIVDPNQVAMEDYFSENKAAVIALALKDPEVISAHQKLGKFYVNRAIKNVRTEMYPGL
jgi:hypothetical protein